MGLGWDGNGIQRGSMTHGLHNGIKTLGKECKVAAEGGVAGIGALLVAEMGGKANPGHTRVNQIVNNALDFVWGITIDILGIGSGGWGGWLGLSGLIFAALAGLPINDPVGMGSGTALDPAMGMVEKVLLDHNPGHGEGREDWDGVIKN